MSTHSTLLHGSLREAAAILEYEALVELEHVIPALINVMRRVEAMERNKAVETGSESVDPVRDMPDLYGDYTHLDEPTQPGQQPGIPDDVCGLCYHPKSTADFCGRPDCICKGRPSEQQLEALSERDLLQEAYDRFVRYEMDVGGDAPWEHQEFMRRLISALNDPPRSELDDSKKAVSLVTAELVRENRKNTRLMEYIETLEKEVLNHKAMLVSVGGLMYVRNPPLDSVVRIRNALLELGKSEVSRPEWLDNQTTATEGEKK